MHKGFVIHSNDLKFNPTEHKKKSEEEKDKQETNSKAYETIRKLVKSMGTNKPTKNNKYLRYNISMVEVIANSLEYTVIDGLSIKLAKTASYITSRRSCTYHPQGLNIYMP